MKKLVQGIFFGNYFIGFLAIVLSIESAVQLKLPLNSINYYILLFCATVFYYTYAYIGPLNSKQFNNPRTEWYKKNRQFINISQKILAIIFAVSGSFFLYQHWQSALKIDLKFIIIIVTVLLAVILYYGLLPYSFYKINLRNTGWLKAFIIGFVWASCVNILSFIVLKTEKGNFSIDLILLLWLFVKNWMFCTVNAIMFDIKDYAHDSNQDLKTFVVRFGLRRTIYLILSPLIIIGLLSLIAFATARNFGIITLLINLVPFVLLFMIARSMLQPHKIMYYLVVIDGVIFIKAICGIAGMQFINH